MKTKKILIATFAILLGIVTKSNAQTNWSTAGNSGTTAGTNFIGTIDPQDLIFKRSGFFSGRIGETNYAFGKNSLGGLSFSNNSIYNGNSILNTNNIAMGNSTLGGFTTGSYNTALGGAALGLLVNGSANTAIGYNALHELLTCVANNPLDQQNVALGIGAGDKLQTGRGNVFIGSYAGEGLVTGNYNVIIGYLHNPTSSTPFPNINRTIIMADGSGISGSNGSGQERFRIDSNGNMGIGYDIFTDGPIFANTDGKLQVNGKIYSLGVQVLSDKRFKKDIKPIESALATIQSIDGKTYAFDKESNKNMNFDDKNHSGFIAQEIEKVLPHLVSTDDKGYKAVNYIELIPYLVEAIKEQQKQINDLKSQISDNFKAQNQDLIELSNTKIINVSPNPSNDVITISFNVEKSVETAVLQVHDLNGTMLSSLNIKDRDNNLTRTLQKDNFGKGIYIVSLVVNGKSIDTKKIAFN